MKEKIEIRVLEQVKMVPVKDVYLYPENPREIDVGQFQKLKKSIIEFGFVDPLVVNRRNDKSFAGGERVPTIMGGNMRYRAATELGLTKLPVSWIDVDKNKERILNIALNKISGKWDIGKLEKMVYELSQKDLELDLELTGMEDWELKLYNPAEDIDEEEIQKLVGTDDKPTFVLKVIFSSEADFERASKLISGEKKMHSILRGDLLLKLLDGIPKGE